MIFCFVERAKELPAAGGIVTANARIVSGREAFCADLAGHAKERLKLYVVVAIGAGDRCASIEIVVYKRAHDAVFKLPLKIHNIVRKVQVLCDARCVIDIIERATAMLRRTIALQFWETTLIPELHRKADDGTRLFLQDGGDGR
ncbi:MAG: hypothetical protein NVS9B14_18770 [Candidatus Acidiferrum sp.]